MIWWIDCSCVNIDLCVKFTFFCETPIDQSRKDETIFTELKECTNFFGGVQMKISNKGLALTACKDDKFEFTGCNLSAQTNLNVSAFVKTFVWQNFDMDIWYEK